MKSKSVHKQIISPNYFTKLFQNPLAKANFQASNHQNYGGQDKSIFTDLRNTL